MILPHMSCAVLAAALLCFRASQVADGVHTSFDIDALKAEIIELQSEFYTALDVPDDSPYAVEYRAGLGLPQKLPKL
jgi:hypothetical protein